MVWERSRRADDGAWKDRDGECRSLHLGPWDALPGRLLWGEGGAWKMIVIDAGKSGDGGCPGGSVDG